MIIYSKYLINFSNEKKFLKINKSKKTVKIFRNNRFFKENIYYGYVFR